MVLPFTEGLQPFRDLSQLSPLILISNASVAFLLNIAAVFLIGVGSGLILTLAGVLKVLNLFIDPAAVEPRTNHTRVFRISFLSLVLYCYSARVLLHCKCLVRAGPPRPNQQRGTISSDSLYPRSFNRLCDCPCRPRCLQNYRIEIESRKQKCSNPMEVYLFAI